MINFDEVESFQVVSSDHPNFLGVFLQAGVDHRNRPKFKHAEHPDKYIMSFDYAACSPAYRWQLEDIGGGFCYAGVGGSTMWEEHNIVEEHDEKGNSVRNSYSVGSRNITFR